MKAMKALSERLALATMWLMPVDAQVVLEKVEDIFFGDLNGDYVALVALGIAICQKDFPALYLRVLDRIWSGDDLQTLEQFILNGINAETADTQQVDDLQELAAGIPYQAYQDFLDVEEMQDVIGWMGGMDFDVLKCLADSIINAKKFKVERDTELPVFQIWAFLAWVGRCSGNAFFDNDAESVQEMADCNHALLWGEGNLPGIIEIQREADTLFASALKGLTLLRTEAAWRECLMANAALARKMIAKGEEENHAKKGKKQPKHNLRWDCA